MNTIQIPLQPGHTNFVTANISYSHSTIDDEIRFSIIIPADTLIPATALEWTEVAIQSTITLRHKDEISTPWGVYSLHDNHGNGFPVVILPKIKPLPEAIIVKFKPN